MRKLLSPLVILSIRSVPLNIALIGLRHVGSRVFVIVLLSITVKDSPVLLKWLPLNNLDATIYIFEMIPCKLVRRPFLLISLWSLPCRLCVIIYAYLRSHKMGNTVWFWFSRPRLWSCQISKRDRYSTLVLEYIYNHLDLVFIFYDMLWIMSIVRLLNGRNFYEFEN